MANIIDPDSDNDGYTDGQEIVDRTDPGDAFSPPTGVSYTGVVKLVDRNFLDTAAYQKGETVFVLLLDAHLNTDPASQEVAIVHITTDTEDTGTPSSATVPVAGPSNQGDGTIGEVATSYTTLTEDWEVICADRWDGPFSVTGSLSGMHKAAQIGTKYTSNNGEVVFTISEGSTNYAVGDSFTFSTTAGDVVSEAVTLTESSADTGVFTGSIALNDSGTPVDGQLNVTSGDTITVIYQDTADDWGNPGLAVDTALYSVTVVSGPMSEDTVWTLANSPYLVTGDVTVNEGVTLTIEPGVKVMFLANSDDQQSGLSSYESELTVYGTLVAQGTSANRIVFTSSDRNPEPYDWGGIRFSNGEGTVEHCQIEYGDYGIYLQNASPTISSNIISNNPLFGIGCVDSNPLIEGNTISNNNSDGIYCDRSSPMIDNNQISNNNGRGINCSSNNVSTYASPEISNNTISGNHYGIYCQYYSTPSITNNTISDNRYYGIQSDFYDANADSSQKITGNTITGNGTGIYLLNYSSPTINQNNLYGNTNYDIRNNTKYDIDAKHNWWGNASLSLIHI